jgi:hypothetical protein
MKAGTILVAWLVLALAAAALGFALWFAADATVGPLRLVIDGEQVSLDGLTGWRGGIAGGLAVALVIGIVAIAVPLALVLGVLLPLALVAAVVLALGAAALGIGLLALSPLLLPLLLAWWLWRRSRRPTASPARAAPAATIDA